jgi:hypothetical protein
MELVKDKRLIGDDGLPLFGVHEGPLEDLSIDAFRLRGQERASRAQNEFIKDFQLKRWQYLGVCDDRVVFGVAIVHLGYMSNVFAYAFDREKRSIAEFGTNRALAAHTEIEGTALRGSARFESQGAAIRMENEPGSVRLVAGIEGKEGRIDAELSFARVQPSLSIVTRVGLDRFNYTNKEAGLPVEGRIAAGGKEYRLSGDRPAGIVDYTYGYLARYTFWNWASGAGKAADGSRIGFNLVQGVNETGFTENAFWIDGRIFKTDVIDFRYDDLHPLKPWRIRSNDGKVDLAFEPEGERSSRINLGVIASAFRQPFGEFKGTFADGGRKWECGVVSGFVEEHESTW